MPSTGRRPLDQQTVTIRRFSTETPFFDHKSGRQKHDEIGHCGDYRLVQDFTISRKNRFNNDRAMTLHIAITFVCHMDGRREKTDRL